MLVEEFLLLYPFVYYIFNACYLCCLVTLKHSNAVFKNAFIALPSTPYSKRIPQGSRAWQHRAGCWWFLTPWRAHWPASQALSCHISYGRTAVETTLSCLNCPRIIPEHAWWEKRIQNCQCLHEWTNNLWSRSSGIKHHETLPEH